MQFLKTLLWIVIAVMLSILATNNWQDVTLNLWGGLQLDIKVPVLLLGAVLAGFLPTWLVMRGKLWRVTRNYAADGRARSVAPPPPAIRDDEPSE